MRVCRRRSGAGSGCRRWRGWVRADQLQRRDSTPPWPIEDDVVTGAPVAGGELRVASCGLAALAGGASGFSPGRRIPVGTTPNWPPRPGWGVAERSAPEPLSRSSGETDVRRTPRRTRHVDPTVRGCLAPGTAPWCPLQASGPGTPPLIDVGLVAGRRQPLTRANAVNGERRSGACLRRPVVQRLAVRCRSGCAHSSGEIR